MKKPMTKEEREIWVKERIVATDAFCKRVQAMPGYAEVAEETEREVHIANMLYEARRLANKTQSDVAKEMGISQSAFSRMERGNATIKNFMRCLNVCGFNLVMIPSSNK